MKSVKKHYQTESVYSIAQYGTCYFGDFLRLEKKQMFANMANVVGGNIFGGNFRIRELDALEVCGEVFKCIRADGQYVVDGNFLTRKEVEELVKKHCRILVLEFWVIEDEEEGDGKV